jgi:hypothetical protein
MIYLNIKKLVDSSTDVSRRLEELMSAKAANNNLNESIFKYLGWERINLNFKWIN